MDYQEYPKTLNHPDFKPARRIAEAVRGRNLSESEPEQWEAARFPAVVVNTADDEEYYTAKGYKAAGNPDPQAFSKANASPYVAGSKHNEWPKMINGVLVQDPSLPTSSFQEHPKWLTSPTGEQVLAETAEQEEALMAQWTAPKQEEITADQAQIKKAKSK